MEGLPSKEGGGEGWLLCHLAEWTFVSVLQPVASALKEQPVFLFIFSFPPSPAPPQKKVTLKGIDGHKRIVTVGRAEWVGARREGGCPAPSPITLLVSTAATAAAFALLRKDTTWGKGHTSEWAQYFLLLF